MTDSHPTNTQDDSTADPTTTTTQHQDEQQHQGSLDAQKQQEKVEDCVEHAQGAGAQPSLSDLGKISTRVTHGLKGHTRSVSSISFSPDGTKLASASADGAIMIWHVILPPQKDALPHVEFMAKLVDETEGERQEGINDIVWSPDSEYLVSASDDHTMHVWAPAYSSRSTSASTTAPIRKLAGHSHCVYCVRFNPIGTLLISGSFDETVKVWDFLAGKLLRTLPGHSEVVSCLDFSRDGSVIVSGSFDGLIRMWDTTSGQCLKTMVVAQETNAPVTFITFTPNSRYLITCSLDSTVRIWDYRSKEGTVVKSYTGHSNVKYSIPARVLTLPTTTQHETDKTCSRDLVVMGSEDGCVCIWDLQSRELLSKNKSHQESIIAISIHPTDPSIVAVAGLDRDPSIKICTLSSPPPPPPTAT